MSDREADVKILRILFANVSDKNYCECPSAKPGIISYDPFDHLPTCRFRKKIRTGRYSVETELSLDKIHDGYALGVVSDN